MQRSLLPAHAPADGRARDRGGLRVVGARRRRRRRLRLPRRPATSAWRSCSATSPATGSTRRPTWRWRSSSSARSRARYPEPGAFLAAANDVVVEEIGAGKFITMLYLTIDLARGEVACASAGHPPPRLVDAGRRRRRASTRRGSCSGSSRASLRGAARAVRARRRGRPLHRRRRRGAARAASCTARSGSTAARRAARAPGRGARRGVLEECRRWVGGDLRDDCAIVVVRRTLVNLRRRRRPAPDRPQGRRRARAGEHAALAAHARSSSAATSSSSTCSTSTTATLVLAHSDDLLEVSHGAARGRVREQTARSLREVAPELPTFDEALELLGEHGRRRPARRPEVARLRGGGRRGDPPPRSGRAHRWSARFHARQPARGSRALEPALARGLTYPFDRRGVSRRRLLAPSPRRPRVAPARGASARG